MSKLPTLYLVGDGKEWVDTDSFYSQVDAWARVRRLRRMSHAPHDYQVLTYLPAPDVILKERVRERLAALRGAEEYSIEDAASRADELERLLS